MKFKLFPDAYVSSIYKIPFEELYNKGYRALLFDIDNTLVAHDAPANDAAKQLFKDLKKIGFGCIAVSNNRRGRVKSFADAVEVPYIYLAAKPFRGAYHKAMSEIGCDNKHCIMIGDQLFTDIWGARRCGIRSILTKPVNRHEKFWIILKRIPEKVILFFYKLRHGNADDGVKNFNKTVSNWDNR